MDKQKLTYYYETYADMIYRIGITYMKKQTDAEDVVQETFLRLVRQQKDFESDEHVKAWLIVTATNYCKSQLTHWWNKKDNIDDMEIAEDANVFEDTQQDMLNAIRSLPIKLKTPIYLYYYEGYSSVEIAHIMKKPAGTIRSYLHQGRLQLKKLLKEEGIWYER